MNLYFPMERRKRSDVPTRGRPRKGELPVNANAASNLSKIRRIHELFESRMQSRDKTKINSSASSAELSSTTNNTVCSPFVKLDNSFNQVEKNSNFTQYSKYPKISRNFLCNELSDTYKQCTQDNPSSTTIANIGTLQPNLTNQLQFSQINNSPSKFDETRDFQEIEDFTGLNTRTLQNSDSDQQSNHTSHDITTDTHRLNLTPLSDLDRILNTEFDNIIFQHNIFPDENLIFIEPSSQNIVSGCFRDKTHSEDNKCTINFETMFQENNEYLTDIMKQEINMRDSTVSSEIIGDRFPNNSSHINRATNLQDSMNRIHDADSTYENNFRTNTIQEKLDEIKSGKELQRVTSTERDFRLGSKLQDCEKAKNSEDPMSWIRSNNFQEEQNNSKEIKFSEHFDFGDGYEDSTKYINDQLEKFHCNISNYNCGTSNYLDTTNSNDSSNRICLGDLLGNNPVDNAYNKKSGSFNPYEFASSTKSSNQSPNNRSIEDWNLSNYSRGLTHELDNYHPLLNSNIRINNPINSSNINSSSQLMKNATSSLQSTFRNNTLYRSPEKIGREMNTPWLNRKRRRSGPMVYGNAIANKESFGMEHPSKYSSYDYVCGIDRPESIVHFRENNLSLPSILNGTNPLGKSDKGVIDYFRKEVRQLDMNNVTVYQLKCIMKEFGLNYTGKKNELIERIREIERKIAIREEGQANENSDTDRIVKRPPIRVPQKSTSKIEGIPLQNNSNVFSMDQYFF